MENRPIPDLEDSAGQPDGVVALFSGGIDSAVMLGLTLAQGRPVWPLYVRQGALWEDAEETAIRHFLARFTQSFSGKSPRLLSSLTVLRLDLPASYASRWAIDPATPAPGDTTPDKAVYLPGRNLALLLQGAALAQSLAQHTIQIGVLAGNPFADSTPAFNQAFRDLYALATGYRVLIETPLAGWTKADVIRAGAGLPLGYTFSCLRPVDGLPCGHCNKCAERRRGFAAAGMADPTIYAPMAPHT